MKSRKILRKSTLIRKYETNYTTISANEDTFNVKNLISQYSWALDILEIRINGLTLSSNEYSKNENEITLAVPIEKPGTSISFVIYKSVDAEAAETVLAYIGDISKLKTSNKTLVDAINEIYTGLKSSETGTV